MTSEALIIITEGCEDFPFVCLTVAYTVLPQMTYRHETTDSVLKHGHLARRGSDLHSRPKIVVN